MIVPGSTSQELAAALAVELDEPLATVERTQFPDGEFLARLPDLAERSPERAVIVASTTSADAHLEVLQLQDAAREAGVEEVVTVLPYLGYARQDAAFEPGEPVTVRAVARALSQGTDRILTVTPHEPSVLEHFDAPATAVEAVDLLAAPVSEELDSGPASADPNTGPDAGTGGDALGDERADPLFLAPDEGARELAETVRDACGAGDVDHFVKHRRSGSEVEIEPSDADVAGRDVVVVDDIVATGSTMSESIAVLNDRGAARVVVACVHALLAADARSKLARAGVVAIHATDTVERPVSTVSAASALAEEL